MLAPTFVSSPPPVRAFLRLRNSAGWGHITEQQAEEALSSSLGGVHALIDEDIVAVARFVGDGVLNIYIQAVIVAEPHRGQGLGQNLLRHLFMMLQSRYPADCTIGLMAAKGQDGFYAQFGFTARPSNVYGAGMIAPLGDICLK